MTYKEKIINWLIKNDLSLSIAESVTGGMISSTIVDVANASKIFKGSIVCYTDSSKIKLLDIPKEIIDKYTAVSSNVAKEMALSIKKKLKSDISIGVTGFAGPFDNNYPSECKVFFSIIIIDWIHEFEMSFLDNGRTNNRITIVSKVLEELIKLVGDLNSN